MNERITPVIEKRGGWYAAYVREVPGANTQGRTRKSARRNLEEALGLIVEVNRELAAQRGPRSNL